MTAYKTWITFPSSRLTYCFKSERAVARMLSGTGRASGGLRAQIAAASQLQGTVKGHTIEAVQLALPWGDYLAA
jgi:hypothetical protein